MNSAAKAALTIEIQSSKKDCRLCLSLRIDSLGYSCVNQNLCQDQDSFEPGKVINISHKVKKHGG